LNVIHIKLSSHRSGCHSFGRLILLRRLKTAEQFAAVLNASKQKMAHSGTWRSAHFVLHMAPLSAAQLLSRTETEQINTSDTYVGVICPKRWAKRAVTRNTFKRQIYAVTRELAHQLPSACLVMRLSASFSREEFKSATSPQLKAAARQEIQSLLGKIASKAAA
jgi:ribonuclease P protein component